ncbi:MAG: fructosamine kinase family protein [Gammaproteobacteria bacterium]
MGHNHFIKRGPPDHLPMYAAEAVGLMALAECKAVRVPEVINYGTDDAGAFLILERFDLQAPTSAASARLGRELAALHRKMWPQFGWPTDNFIGLSPQPNGMADDWTTFFAKQRLGFQLDLAEENGYTGRVTRRGRALIDRLPDLFGHRPRPSLLHGDFWSGNHAMLPDGTPVIFDPAVHYGDRECDLAMAALFGGFHPAFFDAYIEAWPMAAGWQDRWKVYQLYHVLNHLNLFGERYLAQAEALLAEL